MAVPADFAQEWPIAQATCMENSYILNARENAARGRFRSEGSECVIRSGKWHH